VKGVAEFPVIGDLSLKRCVASSLKAGEGIRTLNFQLGSCEHRTEATQIQELTYASPDACTAACTSGPDSVHSDTPKDAPGDDPDNFAEALVMISRLPLTDAKRAEAVRQLLTARDVQTK